MPIKPENRHKYPPEWPVIRLRIQRRADNKCERCGVPNHTLGGRLKGRFYFAVPKGDDGLRLVWPVPGEHWWCESKQGAEWELLRIFKIVCTTAHLDHDETNCSDENLQFLCQRCHLLHDLIQHQQNAYQTRRAGKAIDMFEVRA